VKKTNKIDKERRKRNMKSRKRRKKIMINKKNSSSSLLKTIRIEKAIETNLKPCLKLSHRALEQNLRIN
jgi:hypothetical protein